MNSQDFNHGIMTVNSVESLFNGIYDFYAQFIAGDIDEYEFSDLLDLHIELNNCTVA